MTDEEASRAERLHDEHRRKVWEDSKSGSENFDKYLLTFSSGALALSLAFIKDVVPISQATHIPLLIWSWILFLLCIIVTLISFRISLVALEKMAPYLNEFYLEHKGDAFNKHLKNVWTKAVDWCAYAGMTFFVLGIAFTMAFVGLNLQEQKNVDKENTSGLPKTKAFDSIKPVTMTPLSEGIKPTNMTPVMSDLGKGLKPGGMTPIPTNVPQQPAQPSTPPCSPSNPAPSQGSKK